MIVLKRIRSQWTTTDTAVLIANFFAFLLYIGNCSWQSVWITYAAAACPLLLQTLWSVRRDSALRDALRFGAMVGAMWPLGEWLVVHVMGWWGHYVAPGPKILETPVYCVLIGWLASTYCYYVGKRASEMGFSNGQSALASGLSALTVGILGENLFVAAHMWVYEPSVLDWWQVPAFVPVAYGIAYGTLPLLRKLPLVPATFIFTLITLVVSVSLGLAVGFFPR